MEWRSVRGAHYTAPAAADSLAARPDHGGAVVNISYTEPLSRAWERMKGMLFRPFHIESWFVLGFSAFLAHVFSHTGSFSKFGSFWNGDRHHAGNLQAQQAVDRAREMMLRLLDNPAVLMAIAAALLAFCVVLIVLAWLSARAEFVFLDNVATRRARFVDPWSRAARLGRSLFLWRAAFSFTYLVPLAFILVPFAHTLGGVVREGRLELPAIAAMVIGISTGALLLLAIGWISMLTDNFVVPLMYRHDEHATQAWGRFWPLLTGRPGSFIAFTVFLVVIWIVAAIGLLIAGVGTCCIGIVLMVIPYIGSVVLLPVSVTGRALGPEFLAQFGPEWTTFPAAPAEDDEAPLPVV